MAIKVTPAEFAKDINRRGKKLPGVIKKGLYNGAVGGVGILKSRTPTASERMKGSWRVRKGKGGIPYILNFAPHAGIVEEGARPHPVNMKGILALARWARTVLGLRPKEAKRVAYAIANKIRKEGQKPTYFVRDSMDELRAISALEVTRAINMQARRKVK